MARAVLIDPYTREIKQVDISQLDDFRKFVGTDELDFNTLARFKKEILFLVCDDRGFLREKVPVFFSSFYDNPLAGKIVIALEDSDSGDIVDMPAPIALIAASIKFTELTTDDFEMMTVEVKPTEDGGFPMIIIQPVRKKTNIPKNKLN
jgi:hypothetical protein